MEKEAIYLLERVNEIIDTYSVLKLNDKNEKFSLNIPKDFEEEFFKFIDKVNLSIMEDENFYGYFLFQMDRKLKFDMASPTGVNFKNAKYVIYFNPVIFLTLTKKQMESSIRHEILHIVSLHIIRAKSLKEYSKLAINMAMDIVVNKYLDNLPPFATTLEKVNNDYSLKLEPYETFEYYVDKIQTEIDLIQESEESEDIETEYNPNKTHDIWNSSDDIEDSTIIDFTEKFVDLSRKGSISEYLNSLILSIKNSKGEIPWNLYLKKLMGTIESGKKKIITRRNRRQANRLDLRGELRSHKPEVVVAIDISASISDEEFKQAMKEVLSIVRNYNNEITIVECDNEIKRVYKLRNEKDIKHRISVKGGTRFSPVFEYANKNKVNLLVYFTDGKGEEVLNVVPRGYKVLWVISGRGDNLSLKEPYGSIKKLSKVKMKEDYIDMSDVRNDGYSMNNQAPIF